MRATAWSSPARRLLDAVGMTPRRSPRLANVLSIFIASLATAIAGCESGGGAGLCEAICDCTGCSEDELAECTDDIDDQEKEADDAGCSDQADEYLSCLNEQVECRDSKVDLDGCDTAEKSLDNCLDD